MKWRDLQDREAKPGTGTVTLLRGETTLLIKGTPAEVCEDCGEYYLDEVVARKVYERADEAVQHRVEVEILRYAA